MGQRAAAIASANARLVRADPRPQWRQPSSSSSIAAEPRFSAEPLSRVLSNETCRPHTERRSHGIGYRINPPHDLSGTSSTRRQHDLADASRRQIAAALSCLSSTSRSAVSVAADRRRQGSRRSSGNDPLGSPEPTSIPPTGNRLACNHALSPDANNRVTNGIDNAFNEREIS
jgi:hypothetical protein